jgi:hypothetical protein
MPGDRPAAFVEAVAAERGELWRLAERARLLAKERDRAALRALADEVRDRLEAGRAPTGGHLSSHVGDITAALDGVYDEVFPVRDPGDPADVLDAPWPTGRRTALLGAIVGRPGRSFWYMPPKEPLAGPAIAAGDVRLLRLLVVSPVGHLGREMVVRVLDALLAVDALDTEVVEHALLTDLALGYGILGRSPVNNEVVAPPAACAAAVQAVFDELLWRLTAPDGLAAWTMLPRVLVPRGLRFVRRALGWPADHPMAGRLGAASLTPGERAALVEELREQPMTERLRVFRLRLPAGDAQALLPLLGLADGEPLLTLIQDLSASDVVRQDRAAILAVTGQFGPDGTRRLLELCPSELVSAVLGWNRAAVLKRVKNNALRGIAAYGLLPLQDGETVQDRYQALREVAKRGPKLGPNRRHTHAAAIDVALDHLAQVAGFPDLSSLEWECEARIAGAAPPDARIGDYSAGLRTAGAEPVIVVSKAGQPLKSVPAAVRAHPSYAALREYQELLRDQARRLRAGRIERLVATGAELEPGELARLRGLPSGAALLSALVWRDRAGEIGLLDRLDLTGPVTAVHPFVLYSRYELSRWQAEIVRRRVRQPVKQVFRELYLVTPAERDAVDVSHRFAGHAVNGKVAGQLLSGRGWSTHGEYDKHQATRLAAPGLTAALRCELRGYFGLGDVVVTGEVQFLTDSGPVPLAEVPPLAFSEVMRDLDLVVSVAGTEPAGYASPVSAHSRAQLLSALIEDLGLDRVTVEGSAAVVRGSRATYRVHLTSGSIHLEPGGYLCAVPASFGGTAHKQLFLPFADEDRMTSVILSKVLLLNDDEHITDPVILAQLPPRQQSESAATERS